MPWRETIEAELPPPHEQEPSALRRDILDEIADHLACASDRERRHSNDEATVRRAVIDRFGDPARVARRLWLDAMKETIMQQRAVLVINVVLVLACVALCVLMYAALRQNAQVNTALLAQIESLGQEDNAAAMEWTESTIRVASADGTPAAAYEVELIGRPFDGAAQGVSTIRETTGADGAVTIGPVRPGPYRLRVVDLAGHGRTEQVVLYPTRDNTVDVTWRDFMPADAEVNVAVEMPEALTPIVAYYEFVFAVMPHDDDTPDRAWSLPQLRVFVRPDDRLAVLEASEASIVQEYRADRTRLLHARIDDGTLSFRESFAVAADLGYTLERVSVYFETGGPDRDLRVYGATSRDTSRGRGVNGFEPPPPFTAANGETTTWTIAIPPQICNEGRRLVAERSG